MTLTIELSDDLEAALKAQAQAKGVSAAGYARRVLERALQNKNSQSPKPKKSAYGILAQYGPGPPKEEIEENRREMFRGFGEDIA